MAARKNQSKRRVRRSKARQRLTRVLTALKQKAGVAAKYLKSKHLELSILAAQAVILNKLFSLDEFVREGLIALYTAGYINAMQQGSMLQTIIQSLEVFIKDA